MCFDSSSSLDSSCKASSQTFTKTLYNSIQEISSLPQMLRSFYGQSICFNFSGTDLAFLLPERTLCIWKITKSPLMLQSWLHCLKATHSFIVLFFLHFVQSMGTKSMGVYGLLVASAEVCILFVDFAKIVGKNFEHQLLQLQLWDFSRMMGLWQLCWNDSSPVQFVFMWFPLCVLEERQFLSHSEQIRKKQKGILRGI